MALESLNSDTALRDPIGIDPDEYQADREPP
jgi:hypothetical protein